jgi:hypothetical protein
MFPAFYIIPAVIKTSHLLLIRDCLKILSVKLVAIIPTCLWSIPIMANIKGKTIHCYRSENPLVNKKRRTHNVTSLHLTDMLQRQRKGQAAECV